MRKRCIPVYLALLLAATGCSTRSQQVTNRPVGAAGAGAANARIAMHGCVAPAIEGSGYSLRHVIVLPSTAEEGPPNANAGVLNGSSVTLVAGKHLGEDIRAYLNNEVTLTGELLEESQPPRFSVESVERTADFCSPQ
jgi:hypothetical protein